MQNMEIKTGSLIVVDGKTLVVTDIRTEEKIGGRAVHISACDQETARTAQGRNIQGNDATQQLMEKSSEQLLSIAAAAESPLSGDDLLIVSHYVEEVAKMVAQREKI
jgi:hypothetical protein